MMNFKPVMRKYSANEWEFIYPEEMDNEKEYKQFCNALDLLDHDDATAELTFKHFIKQYPFYLDAYNHLSIAFRNQEKYFESYLTAEKAYRLGKQCLPKEFSIKKDKLIWSNLDNRPFLRACQIWALELQENNEFDKALGVYKELLALNEEDHQGVRYLKLECHFALKDYKGAQKLINKYLDDWSIEFAYGKVLLAVLGLNEKKAKHLLADAIKVNSFLPAEVVKKKHVPPTSFQITRRTFF